MPTVRPATEADLAAIVAVYNDAVLHTTAIWNETPVDLDNRRVWFAERTRRGFPVLVAEWDGSVAGYASYGDFRAFDGYRHTVEHSVYVDAARRGGGVGRALLAATVAAAERAGVHVMVGGIEAENTASIRLHESLGFVRAGVLHQVGRKFGRWLDLLFMERVLGG